MLSIETTYQLMLKSGMLIISLIGLVVVISNRKRQPPTVFDLSQTEDEPLSLDVEFIGGEKQNCMSTLESKESFVYLAGWGKGSKSIEKIKQVGDRIQKASSKILDD